MNSPRFPVWCEHREYALGTHVPRDTGGNAEKLHVTLRSQFHGEPVPNGVQERPSLGPLGLCVRGFRIRFHILGICLT